MKKRRLFLFALLLVALLACWFWIVGAEPDPTAIGLRVVARTNDTSDVQVVAFEVTNRSPRTLQLFCKSSLGEISGPHLLPGGSAQCFTLKDEALSGEVNGRVYLHYTPVRSALVTRVDRLLQHSRTPFRLIRWTRVQDSAQVPPNKRSALDARTALCLHTEALWLGASESERSAQECLASSI